MADDLSTTAESRRHRLPTLLEVLSRRTQSPVDLFAFYVYMRDQQRSVDYLDFWLDVSQHLALCRHFVRHMRRSVLFETPDLDKAGSKRSSQILDSFEPPAEPGIAASVSSEKTEDARVSAFLRSDSASHHSHKQSSDSNNSRGATPIADQHPRPSFMTSNLGDSSSPGDHSTPQNDSDVKREDLKASAEKILYTYLLSGSEREIIIPRDTLHRITEAIEEQGRDDPQVFDEAKDYVFQAMERDAFPGFLQSKAFGNLVPASLLMRVIISLVAAFGAFWAAWACILLDYSRATRCWLILPSTVSSYALGSYLYKLDPILVFLGRSELTFMSFVRVNEPFVKTTLRKRALVCCFIILLLDAIIPIAFVVPPHGHRL